MTLLVAMLLGADCIDDCDLLRSVRLLGFRVMAPVLSDVLCGVVVTDSALGAGKGRRDQAEVRDEGGWVVWVRPCREFR
jgi:hypothetical protein